MKTFWIRTASALVYAVLFLGSIFMGRITGNNELGIIVLAFFGAFVASGCAIEYYRIAELGGNHPSRYLGIVLTAMTTLAMALFADWADSAQSDIIVLIAFTIMGLIVFLSVPCALMAQLWRDSQNPFGDVLHTLLPVIYCAIPLGLMTWLNDNGILPVCVLLVWGNDSFAYIGGSLVGKHKMWPKHSPGKTWEGTAIGVVCCMAIAYFVGPLFNSQYPMIAWIVLGLICGVVGTLGDLVESMLKRSVGLKDSGNIMPGHGGFLDRFDSLLMILPFAFVIMFLFSLITNTNIL
ncbi:MAG: phosphatidate cytidylyltransferase [Bacteroidales bacterium]|nr:phosphatidate cytidylyltransferase [Bacteroidales bacterium]